jgi:hypothetical protein
MSMICNIVAMSSWWRQVNAEYHHVQGAAYVIQYQYAGSVQRSTSHLRGCCSAAFRSWCAAGTREVEKLILT